MTCRGFILQKEDDLEYTSFLEKTGMKSSSVLGYHFPFYRSMLEEIGVGTPMYIGLRDQNDNLVAILPGFIKHGDLGTVYSSLPFFGPNAGILVSPEINQPELVYQHIFNYLFEQLGKFNMLSASIYTPFNHSELLSFYRQFSKPSIVIDKFTSYIKLEHLSVNKKLEYDIRKALKMGVTLRTSIRDEADIQAIFQIYRKNCEDYGIPVKPRECIQFLLEQSTESKNIGIYLAEYENKIIGALIMIYSPTVASYYLPCSLHEYRSYQPVSFLIHHAFRDAMSRSIKIWNWESSPSKESGVFKFKQKWGSEEGEYKIFVYPYRDQQFFKNTGQQNIEASYPYYFVYPFSLISDDHA